MTFALTIPKEEIMNLPIGAFDGKVVLAQNHKEIAGAMQEINQCNCVGFDTEARPTFKKGQIRKVSLIQVAIPNKVFLLRIMNTGLTDELLHFFENDSLLKIGIGLTDDYHLLRRLRDFKPRGFLDLNSKLKQLGAEKIGARNLAAMILKIRISKTAQISNWENEVLTPGQIRYAATDAWICLEIYNRILSFKC